MGSQNIAALAKTLPELEITPGIDLDEAMKSITMLGQFNGCMMGLVRFSGETAWERHPAGDELLQVLSGKTHITLLTDDGPERFTATAGDIVTVPKGLWHAQLPDPEVSLFFITPGEGSERSLEQDPRKQTG